MNTLMKMTSTIAFLLLMLNVRSQDFIKFQDSIHTSIKEAINSIVIQTDAYKPYSIVNDTTRITDINDPSKTVGFVIDQFYFAVQGTLKKAVLYNYNLDRSIYYFADSLLVKVIITDLNGSLLKEFYYSKDDNQTSSFVIFRITKLYPSLSNYYTGLEIGRSYLRQSIEKRR